MPAQHQRPPVAAPYEAMPDAYELTTIVYGLDAASGGWIIVTDAQLSAVRRALKALVAEGHIVAVRGWRDHCSRWCTPEVYAASRRLVPSHVLGLRGVSEYPDRKEADASCQAW